MNWPVCCGRSDRRRNSSWRLCNRFFLLSTLCSALPSIAAFAPSASRSPLFSTRTPSRFIGRRTAVPPTSSITDDASSARRKKQTPIFTCSEEATDHTGNNKHHHHQQDDLSSGFLPTVDISRSDKILVTIMTVATFASFGGLVRLSGPGAWRYFLAGGICAATSHAITTPIDVVKTRKQVDSSLRNSTFVEATSRIVKSDGVHALAAGLGPTTVGYLFEGALKFGIYEALKPAIRTFLSTIAQATHLSFLNSKVIGFVLSGTASGVAASAMLCPMEAIRIRQVAEPDFAPSGWVHAGLKMLKNEGLAGLWKGMTPMLYKQVPYTVTKNVSFDFLTTLSYAALRKAGVAMNRSTVVLVPLVSAFVASILSCISSQPGDMLLSLVNAHEGDKNANDYLKQVTRKRGLRGLFVGTNARFLHVGIIVTVQLLIYDFVKQLVGIAATGSV